MVKTRRRAIYLFLVFLLEIILLVLGFYYIPLLASYSRMSVLFVLWVWILPVLSIGMILVVLWYHFAMKLPLPPSKQSFLHPRVMKEKIGKGMILWLALLVFESLSSVTTSIAFLLSIAIILGSWYSIIVEFELCYDFPKYTSLYNPLKRKDEL